MVQSGKNLGSPDLLSPEQPLKLPMVEVSQQESVVPTDVKKVEASTNNSKDITPERQKNTLKKNSKWDIRDELMVERQSARHQRCDEKIEANGVTSNVSRALNNETKAVFWALLESAQVESDWTWREALGVIKNDQRFASLKLGAEIEEEFRKYLKQQAQRAAEEKLAKYKNACSEFQEMLEECKELTSSTEWLKAVSIFRDDERFGAIERSKERLRLFKNYCIVLQNKEKANGSEKHKRLAAEYRNFLESRGTIKVNTQWKQVRKLLEDDKDCPCLEKIYHSDIFHEYIQDLQMEEHKKMQKEHAMQEEQKKRDDFHNVLKRHWAHGSLDTKTSWTDFFAKVKDTKLYMAVASNSTGPNAKEIFEDFIVDRQKEIDKSFKDGYRYYKLADPG